MNKIDLIDSHFHIWDLDKLILPWLSAKEYKVINKNFSFQDYLMCYGRKEINLLGGIYVEVDCDNYECEDYLISQESNPLLLNKILKIKLSKSMRIPANIAGVREVLHTRNDSAKRYEESDFIEGLEVLGDLNLVFESCNKPEDLEKLYNVAKLVPKTTIVLNHMGNPNEFNSKYKNDLKKLASLSNVFCKVSGFHTDNPVQVSEKLNFIKNIFDKYHLLYASNFPVIYEYANFDLHLDFLLNYFSGDEDFFSRNAKKIYKLNKVQRFASIIKLHPEKIDYYEFLHKNPWTGVNKMIRNAGITKYSIYRRKDLLFSYMEYQGDDYEKDMSNIATDELTRLWWKETDPCQYPINDAQSDEWWAEMKQVYNLGEYDVEN